MSLSAAVTQPDIVATSTGSVLNVEEDYFRSGVDTSIGLGSVALAFFACGPVALGEQVSVTDAPDAPITFSGILLTWNQPQDEVVFDPMSLVSFAMYVERPSDDPAYFSMIPEPSRSLLLGLALATLLLRRHRH